MPVCKTAAERMYTHQVILDRVTVVRPGRPYLYTQQSPDSAGRLMLECIERLQFERKKTLLEACDVSLHTRSPIARFTQPVSDWLSRMSRKGRRC